MQFLRIAEFIAPGQDIFLTAEDLNIHFRIPFGDISVPRQGEVELYNLSANTKNRLTEGEPVLFNAGYAGHKGNILAGEVVRQEGRRDGVNTVLSLIVSDAVERWKKTVVNKAYKPDITADQIIKDIVGDFGLELADIDLPLNPTYENGRTISTAFHVAIRQLADDCEAKFYMIDGNIYVRPPEKGDDTVVVLNPDTGLIESPQPSEGGYLVRCLLNHEISVDKIIKVESRTLRGFFRVREGYHMGNERDHITQCKVVEA